MRGLNIPGDWKYELTKLKLHNEDGEYYLEAVYNTESKHKKGILTIPHIPLHIASTPHIEINEDIVDSRCMKRTCEVNLGFGPIYLKSVSDRPFEREHYFKYKVTEEKVEELTLFEIEQRLGYKVKVVAEKEDSYELP